jgi:hypothetical protein
MTVDERSRHELYLRLEEVLGPDPANTMMEHLPPVGWADVATKQDLEGLRAATRQDLDEVKREVAAEFRSVRQEMAAEFRSFRTEVAAEFKAFRTEVAGMRHEIVGTMRPELMSQTRAMFLAIVTIVLTMASLTFALAH